MPQRFQREVILIGLLAIFFVQICPMFDDPTPLSKARAPISAAIVVFFLLSFAWRIRHGGFAESEVASAQTVPLFDLTCARLC